MSVSDNYAEERKAGRIVFNQPWSTFAEPGERFRNTAEKANEQGRPVMVLAEISQSEVWDPVCHNMPNPHKVIRLFRTAAQLDGVNGVCDFWGHRGPFLSHANHCAMRAWLDRPADTEQELLKTAAAKHYNIDPADTNLVDAALRCWQQFADAVDDWALTMWGQRLSYAVGRDGARGFFYRALIPENLRWLIDKGRLKGLEKRGIDIDGFNAYLHRDRDVFSETARRFERLADALRGKGSPAGASLADREAVNIELAGELIAGTGRTFAAAIAFRKRDAERLRQLIEEEIEARARELELSGRTGWGAGVNPLLVEEDMQNMCLYLSRDDFPDSPDECFHFTYTPYSM